MVIPPRHRSDIRGGGTYEPNIIEWFGSQALSRLETSFGVPQAPVDKTRPTNSNPIYSGNDEARAKADKHESTHTTNNGMQKK